MSMGVVPTAITLILYTLILFYSVDEINQVSTKDIYVCSW